MSVVAGEAFLGVLAGFLLNRAYGWYRDGENGRKLKKSLKHELETCMSRLTGKGLLLPTTFWNAAIASGDLRLLSFDERMRLSQVYFEIGSHNSAAQRIKDTEVVSGAAGGDRLDGMPAARAYWVNLRKDLFKNEESLKETISELLKSLQ